MKAKINLVLLGIGNVGSEWLNLFNQLKLQNEAVANVQLIAVANSAKALIAEQGVSPTQINEFATQAKSINLSGWISELKSLQLPNVVVLDLTASSDVANQYLEFAELGWHIISANKLPLTSSKERYKLLVNTLNKNRCFWGINATVGAALPVQNSLNDLLQAGDLLQELSGVFSGSLSYLLANYDGQSSFTELVKQARDAGYTEPDPRDDLSGTDVQRKLLILSRIAGYSLDLADIQAEPLLPAELLADSLESFWQQQAAIDAYMASQYAKAKQQNKKLVYQAKGRFVGQVVEGNVGLNAVNDSNPMAQLTPTDNVFIFKTDSYSDNPLVVRGPGAGARVTAMAVNIDLNKFITQIAIAAEKLA